MTKKASFKVRHSCGHTERHSLVPRSPVDVRQRKEWLATKPCSTCRTAAEDAYLLTLPKRLRWRNPK